MAAPPGTFPTPRVNRTGPPAASLVTAPGVAAVPPTARVIGLNVTCAASARSTASSARILGPALVKGIHLSLSGAPTNQTFWELGVALAPVTEQNVALGTARNYRPLFEAVRDPNDAGDTIRFGDGALDQFATLMEDVADLAIPILDQSFFLTITLMRLGGAGNTRIRGHVVVLEGVSLDALRNFL